VAVLRYSSSTMSNQINGGRARTNALSSVDFYRRVPKDLTEVGRNRIRRALTLAFASEAFYVDSTYETSTKCFSPAPLPPQPVYVWVLSL
jgi:hypothetical protein